MQVNSHYRSPTWWISFSSSYAPICSLLPPPFSISSSSCRRGPTDAGPQRCELLSGSMLITEKATAPSRSPVPSAAVLGNRGPMTISCRATSSGGPSSSSRRRAPERRDSCLLLLQLRILHPGSTGEHLRLCAQSSKLFSLQARKESPSWDFPLLPLLLPLLTCPQGGAAMMKHIPGSDVTW